MQVLTHEFLLWSFWADHSALPAVFAYITSTMISVGENDVNDPFKSGS